MTELKVSFPTEKLDALRFFMDKKQQTIEQELKDYLDKTYEKLVPAQVREYVESRMEQAPAQQAPEPEQAPAARERPARQTRRQREQAAAESSSAPEAPSEAEGLAEQESQGMTMSM
jgi:hypothetical protein